jgi:transcriptional regulator with XRE-family HTH domain
MPQPSDTDAIQLLAERLRIARAKLQLNQQAFCEKAGITPNTLRALERGARYPSRKTLAGIAQCLETSLTDLMNGQSAPAKPVIVEYRVYVRTGRSSTPDGVHGPYLDRRNAETAAVALANRFTSVEIRSNST